MLPRNRQAPPPIELSRLSGRKGLQHTPSHLGDSGHLFKAGITQNLTQEDPSRQPGHTGNTQQYAGLYLCYLIPRTYQTPWGLSRDLTVDLVSLILLLLRSESQTLSGMRDGVSGLTSGLAFRKWQSQD